MERLTEWIDDGEEKFAISRLDSPKIGDRMCLNKLAEYEDLEKQGLLLRLPCKVGDTVYFPHDGIGYIFAVVINQIVVSDLGDGRYCVQYNGCFFDGNGDLIQNFEFEEDDFDKTVFLTRAEAEEALQEMEAKL